MSVWSGCCLVGPVVASIAELVLVRAHDLLHYTCSAACPPLPPSPPLPLIICSASCLHSLPHARIPSTAAPHTSSPPRRAAANDRACGGTQIYVAANILLSSEGA